MRQDLVEYDNIEGLSGRRMVAPDICNVELGAWESLPCLSDRSRRHVDSAIGNPGLVKITVQQPAAAPHVENAGRVRAAMNIAGDHGIAWSFAWTV
jgi:hypothetical protein